MELPESFRKPLEYISRNVLFEQTHSFIPENDTFMPHGKEIQHAANGQISVSSEGAGWAVEIKDGLQWLSLMLRSPLYTQLMCAKLSCFFF